MSTLEVDDVDANPPVGARCLERRWSLVGQRRIHTDLRARWRELHGIVQQIDESGLKFVRVSEYLHIT